jgi:hypothetical protein
LITAQAFLGVFPTTMSENLLITVQAVHRSEAKFLCKTNSVYSTLSQRAHFVTSFLYQFTLFLYKFSEKIKIATVSDQGNINITFRATSGAQDPSDRGNAKNVDAFEERMDHFTPAIQNEMTTLISHSRDLFRKNEHDIKCFTATDT